jgi:PAP_fibrillin
MKLLVSSHVLLVFGGSLLDKFSFLAAPTSANSNVKTTTMDELRNEKVQDLLQAVKEVGPVAFLASKEEQQRIEQLAAAVIPLSESNAPAKWPLIGEHQLVYSAAPGVSSGRVFGNVVGKVTQVFENDQVFYNRVAFGPFLQIALQVQRKVLDDSTIQVSFLETTFSLFDQIIKRSKTDGGGIWNVKFVGTVVDAADGNKKKLIRIMDAPSLFILEQTLE